MISRRFWDFLSLVAFCLVCMTACTGKQKVSYTTPYTPYTQEQQGRAELLANHAEARSALKTHFATWEGTQYRNGGLSRSGVDCSGFTLLTYKKLFGVNLPRTTSQQADSGRKISRSALAAGDLVFFKTGFFQKHVGIYLEDGMFIHASSSKGVMMSSLNDSYWQEQYWQAKRL